MKLLRNSARLIKTTLGGDCCVPSAVLRSDSTTTILVNEVIVTSNPGANDSTAIKATSCIIRAVVDPPGSPISKVRLCDRASSGAKMTKMNAKKSGDSVIKIFFARHETFC